MSTPETVQILLALHEHHERQARHHDDQNTKVVSLVLVLASAALGLVGFDSKITAADVLLGVFMLLIGCYGAAFSTKHYERHFRKKLAAHKVLDGLEENCSDEIRLRELRMSAESTHQGQFPKWLMRMPLYYPWIAVHFFVVIFGIIITVLALMAE